jgi:hypothetical protein
MLLSVELLGVLDRLLDEEAQSACTFSGLVSQLVTKIQMQTRLEIATLVQANQHIPASGWSVERLDSELSQMTWEKASRAVKEFVPLSTDVKGSSSSAEFSKLCLNLGLQVSSHGRTFFVKMMKSLEENINPNSVDTEETPALAKQIAEKQGKKDVNMFTTTARNQAVAFHLLTCAFSINGGDEKHAITCANELIKALWRYSVMKKTNFAESAGTGGLVSLSDILQAQGTQTPLPLLGKIFLKLEEVNAGRFVSSENIIYLLSWVQLERGGLNSTADRVLSTMMLMFMLTRSPALFSGVGETFKAACLEAVGSNGILPESVISELTSLLGVWIPGADTSGAVLDLVSKFRSAVSEFERPPSGTSVMYYTKESDSTMYLNGSFSSAGWGILFGVALIVIASTYLITLGKVNLWNMDNTAW